ncbi:1-deoxy-D-xylulose-5-phosphate reductoisomerase [bacterium]|nr:1-deoxy-D-xylulose-5-phosphate reductoisomerase [bacterium]
MKRISILGSTGSIGTQTLDVVSSFPELFNVIGLFGGKNLDLLQEQIEKFHPKIVGIQDANDITSLREFMNAKGLSFEIVCGEQGLVDFVDFIEIDLLVVAITGTASLLPTLAAIERKIPIGIASKEVLVAAGHIVMKRARENNVPILPIDSEHAALKQCMAGVKSIDDVSKLILTASGGPFRDRDANTFDSIKLADALKHPNWEMGKKITIDSATMMNKGLEVLEAHQLFGVPMSKIDVYVHPQSIVHSLVEFVDGNLISQMGLPDMRFPIQYVLMYPNKIHCEWPRADLSILNDLQFFRPDFIKFPLLKLAYDVGEKGGNMPAVYNAANEAAVQLFLEEKISFVDIYKTVYKAVESETYKSDPDLEFILDLDARVKKMILNR